MERPLILTPEDEDDEEMGKDYLYGSEEKRNKSKDAEV